MTPSSSRILDVRPVTAAELPAWLTAQKTVFLRTTDPLGADAQPEAMAERLEPLDPARTLGAFDEAAPRRCVATFRSFPQRLTVVGGATVPADAVTNVGVAPTHRRRGLLSRMMAHDLAAAKERGDVVATLIAAEYPIYGRFGFGPAAHTAEWTVEVPAPAWTPGGRVPRTAAGSTSWTARTSAGSAPACTRVCAPSSRARSTGPTCGGAPPRASYGSAGPGRSRSTPSTTRPPANCRAW